MLTIYDILVPKTESELKKNFRKLDDFKLRSLRSYLNEAIRYLNHLQNPKKGWSYYYTYEHSVPAEDQIASRLETNKRLLKMISKKR